MGEFRYIPPDEVAARHRAARPAKAAPRQPGAKIPDAPPEQRNVEVVLSLGDVRYVHFRQWTFRCPPIPFKLGQKVLDSHTKVLAHARQVATTGKKEPMKAYYAELAVLVDLLWRHLRPASRVGRLLWRLGLTRNPLRLASEAEVKAITDFFLKGRMTSSVRSMSETEAQAQ